MLPSAGEGIPLIVIEALASARPVVCSRVGAVGEVVDSRVGILVVPGKGETARFAAAIHRLLDDAVLRREMGMAGRRKVESGYGREKALRAYREPLAE